jgi:hypothetical protein
MEGSTPKTVEDTSRTTQTSGPLAHMQTAAFCTQTGQVEGRAELRARLIAATVEAAAEGSAPRLVKTLRIPTTAWLLRFRASSPHAARV